MASTAFRPTQLVSTQSGRKGYQKDAGTCSHNRVVVLGATVKSHALEKHPAVPQSVDRLRVLKQSYPCRDSGEISREEMG